MNAQLITDMPRPIKRRSKNYRLPIGALSCVLIWFFWMVATSQPAAHPATDALLTTQASLLSVTDITAHKVFDYRSAIPFEDSSRAKLHDALQYFALTLRKKRDYDQYAVVLLPREVQYQEFVELAQLAQKENFFLKMQGDSLLMGRRF